MGYVAKYLPRGREKKIAQTYMKEGALQHDRWGASGKVKDLETRYPRLFPQRRFNHRDLHANPATGITSTRLDSAFDLATVLKASQAIEIELDRRFCSLMQILTRWRTNWKSDLETLERTDN